MRAINILRRKATKPGDPAAMPRKSNSVPGAAKVATKQAAAVAAIAPPKPPAPVPIT